MRKHELSIGQNGCGQNMGYDKSLSSSNRVCTLGES